MVEYLCKYVLDIYLQYIHLGRKYRTLQTQNMKTEPFVIERTYAAPAAKV